MIGVYVGANSYIVDSFPEWASSAMAAKTLISVSLAIHISRLGFLFERIAEFSSSPLFSASFWRRHPHVRRSDVPQ